MNLLRRLGSPLRVQAACFRALACLGIHVHPRDEELVARFSGDREVFEAIRAMLCEDSHLGYLGHSRIRVIGEARARTQDDPGISPERWDRYRQLMRQIGVVAVSHVGHTITMRVSTRGRSSKGFVHSPAHRVVVSSLERYPLPPEQHAHLILDEPWHVYFGWES